MVRAIVMAMVSVMVRLGKVTSGPKARANDLSRCWNWFRTSAQA
jgi:hypothetical protein